MLSWLSRLSVKKGIVGIELLNDGLAVAVRGAASDDLESAKILSLKHGDVARGFNDSSNASGCDSLSGLLTDFVDTHRLKKRACHVILRSDDYQLLLVESPEVPEAELKDAVRWRIKDLVSKPIDDVVVDVFVLPEDASRAGKKMVYVAVAELNKIQSIANMVSEAGLYLATVDIGEFALRNLTLIRDNSRSVAVARVTEGHGVLSIYRNGNLYLSRQFKLDYDAGLLSDLPNESFALELQRSLDYFERQMGQSPPAVIYICGESISEDKVTVELSRGLTIPVEFFDIKSLVSHVDDIDASMTQLCVAAIGATYRNEAA